ncbi:MAG TPA: hypothetical protein VKG44_11385 [Candidatus Baltobacteraceae bacterium]|nr:hypothetical protein [Candidatus Baltobacteraceae bacterium]
MSRSQRSENLFVVRVWREPSQFAASRWRGSLQHVNGKQQVYFSDVGSLPALINERLEDDTPIPTEKTRKTEV